jgi:hypothetical protein
MKRSVQLSHSDNVINLPFEFCIVCGTSNGVTKRSFEATEDNPIAQFAKLAGDVSIIAEYVLNKPHSVSAPFCRRCFSRFETVKFSEQLFQLLFVLTIFFSIVVSIYVHSIAGIEPSLIPFAIGICMSICLKSYSRFNTWKKSPKIRTVNKKRLVLKVPGHGKIVCHRS